MSRKRRPPIGTAWRTLVYTLAGQAIHTHSADLPTDKHTDTQLAKRTVFDELVISGVLHVEQMDTNYWWIGIPTRDGGLIHVDIHVDPRKRAARSVMVRDDRGDTTTRLAVDSRLPVGGGA